MPRTNKVASILPVGLEKDDISTIVSIVPFLVSEFKPGIYPGRFVIQPCKDFRKPEILEVGMSVYFIPQFNGDEELPAHVVKTSSREIATAVVNDYLAAQMDVDTGCQPGIIALPGKVAALKLTTDPDLRLLYDKLKRDQMSWFAKLVQRADNDWNRYKRHTVISDNQRFACRALGLEKDWLTPNHMEIPVKCPACQTNCVQEAIVCGNCRCILKPEEYKKLTFAA